MTRRPCPACRGTGIQHIRAACHYVPCYVCRARGVILLSLPPVPPGVPSSGGNCLPEGGEKQLKKWIGMLALLLGCVYPSLAMGPPDADQADAGADLIAVSDAGRNADLIAAPPDATSPTDLQPAVDLQPDSPHLQRGVTPQCPAGGPQSGYYGNVVWCNVVVAGYTCCAATFHDQPLALCIASSVFAGGAEYVIVADCSQCAGLS